MMIKFLNRVIIIILISYFFIVKDGRSQSLTGNKNPFIARFSSGWNYYSRGASLNPQLSEFTQYAMLNYRTLDDSNRIIWQIRTDIYQKDAVTQTRLRNQNEQFDHRTVIRQAYGSYTLRDGEVKLGRFVPIGTHTDAYPINGLGAENTRITSRWRGSVYGGKIFDEYDNRPEGIGYSTGGSLTYDQTRWQAGAGLSAEQLRNTRLTKAYLFGEYRPSYTWRIVSNNQYVVNKALLGYSQNTLYYRLNKNLSTRFFAEYHDRRAYFPAPTDSLSMDRFFNTTQELMIGGSVRYRIFQWRKIGMLETMPSLKKRLGNDNLTYAALQFFYQNYFFWRFNLNTGFSYTDNQWIRNYRSHLSLNKDFFASRLDASFSLIVNTYTWNSTSSRAKLLTTVSADATYRFDASWYISAGIYEEVGNATDPHSGVNIRMFYYLH
ncbi:MAG TPA: hypothetical protein PLG25_06810 [bacterium]|nr:hypothetical protein [bacterium]HNE83567.1 hypothetical protein [bacterium]HNH29694.1 hypothetical protein [bacterium]HNH30991.1 hypothetical protein [bacterium]HNI09804.1 hypothetical protein [bacterium]